MPAILSCRKASRRTEDPRHLFPYIADGIRECQPRIVFLENVEGIISAKTADGESVLQYVLRELEGLGYRATAGVFSAAEVGAPHQRKRVFIIGLAYSDRRGMLEGHRAGMQQGEGRQSNWDRVRSATKRLNLVSHHDGLLDQASDSTTGKSQESQQWPTPRANKVHPVITEENREQLANRKKANLEEEIAGHCGKSQGKLNPDWVEHLMGLPAGWTDFAFSEME